MRFLLFVEGSTERDVLPDFFKRWLDPQLKAPIAVKIIRFKGVGDYLNEIANKVHLSLTAANSGEIIGAVGLIDLYQSPRPENVSSVEQRIQILRQRIIDEVAHPRFSQHFAVHETEAWLLSDLTIFPENTRSAFPGKCAMPEQVNFDEPPAALLSSIYRNRLKRPYRKVIDGKNLFLNLDPNAARKKCPYLRGMMDSMLATARAAGLTKD